VQEPGCHLFTLLGEAGVGKSRLVAELLSMVDEAAIVLGGRCLHYREGITFSPVVEALTPFGEPAQPVLRRISSRSAATPQELFWEVDDKTPCQLSAQLIGCTRVRGTVPASARPTRSWLRSVPGT
jgi:hypothetical protein